MEWLDELPLEAGPPHVRVGTRRVAASEWLVTDGRRPTELALKDRLLAERRSEVVAVAVADHRPATDRAQAEALTLIRDWQRRHPPRCDPAEPADLESDRAAPPPRHHAPDLEAAARRVQEDLCLMRTDRGAPVLVAAVVCFPSYWRLADKIGRPMATIHGPVPGYTEELGDRPDRVLAGLAGDRIVARRNWSIHDGGDLFAPSRPSPRPLAPDEVGERLWLRSERQTLRRLPAGDHVLFTIRVQQLPFAELSDRAGLRARLAAAVRAEAPSRLDRLTGAQVAPVLAWLDGAGADRDR